MFRMKSGIKIMRYGVRFRDSEMEKIYKYEGKLATSPILEFIAKYSNRCRGNLVDIGCGNKPYIDFFSHVDRHIGVDIAGDEADIIADAVFLPLQSDSIDVVLCNQVLEHESEPDKLLVEISRILKEGGLLILSAPQMGRLHGEPYDYYRYTRWGLKYLIEKNGMKIDIVESHGGFFRSIGSHFDFFIIDYFGKNKCIKNILRFTVININNFMSNFIDNLIRWEKDTLGYNIIARKGVH